MTGSHGPREAGRAGCDRTRPSGAEGAGSPRWRRRALPAQIRAGAERGAGLGRPDPLRRAAGRGTGRARWPLGGGAGRAESPGRQISRGILGGRPAGAGRPMCPGRSPREGSGRGLEWPRTGMPPGLRDPGGLRGRGRGRTRPDADAGNRCSRTKGAGGSALRTNAVPGGMLRAAGDEDPRAGDAGDGRLRRSPFRKPVPPEGAGNSKGREGLSTVRQQAPGPCGPEGAEGRGPAGRESAEGWGPCGPEGAEGRGPAGRESAEDWGPCAPEGGGRLGGLRAGRRRRAGAQRAGSQQKTGGLAGHAQTEDWGPCGPEGGGRLGALRATSKRKSGAGEAMPTGRPGCREDVRAHEAHQCLIGRDGPAVGV
jgi:hypothetical protein